MADRGAADVVWYGTGLVSRVARAALLPAEQIYRAVIAARGAMYDRGVLRSHAPAVPALSVGNLSVGGTGKTPVTAWAAGQMLAAGARPAIVLRGYGGDEALVHARLHPGVPVITSPDRVAGAREAKSGGADVIVLDDAFQHRRVGRQADWVLISADRWMANRPHLLPAGPWREPLGALARASVVLITRKAASRPDAEAVRAALLRSVPRVPISIAHLAPDGIQRVDGHERRAMDTLRGVRARLVAAVGDPAALQGQLESHGMTVEPHFFPDHHGFTDREIARLSDGVGSDTLVVCTLKDAVKIGPRWPRAAPAIWYVSQRVIVEDGLDQLSRSILSVLQARSPATDATGAGRSSF